MFTPSTEWHPLDKTDASPHHQHRQVLGRYEAIYNRVVHGFPVAPDRTVCIPAAGRAVDVSVARGR